MYLILEIFNYQESYDGSVIAQAPEALVAIRVIIGLLPGILFIISVIFGKKANLDRDRFNFIKKEIENRKKISK